MVKKVGALLLLAALLFLLGVPAQAATKTVTLSDQGPSPTSLALKAGDIVKFVNSGNSSHQVDSVAGWTFHRAIQAGASASTPAFTKAGTYTYDDSYTLVAVPQTARGTFTVTAGTPTTPSPTPKPSATRTTSPTPKPSAGQTQTPSPTSAATSSGVAIAPGLGTGIVPTTPPPSATIGPNPDIAPPQPSAAGSRTPLAIAYGGKDGVVQSSPHRYGLPAALAVVGIVGVLSLLVRLLLAEPASRRTA